MMRAEHISSVRSYVPASDTTSTASGSSPGPSPRRQCFSASSSTAFDSNTTMNGRHLMLEGQAPRACEKCRASKRKCDKKLPFCDRCTRLNAKCYYIQDPVVNNPNNIGAQVVLFQHHSLSSDALFAGVEPLEGITISQILSLVSLDAAQGESSHVDWRYSITLFFHCIHPWFAVVHPALFNQQLCRLLAMLDAPSPADSQSSPPYSNSHTDNQVAMQATPPGHTTTPDMVLKEVALLVVAMYLTIRMRMTDAGEQHMFDETYRTAKRMSGLLLVRCAGGPLPSIELVQCGALIAMYEYGHGEMEAAYQTLSQIIGVARVLNIKPGQLHDSGDDEPMSNLEEEQNGCLWWGMFILEQFIHQDETTRHLPFILESPSPSTLLPDTPPLTPLPSTLGSAPLDVSPLRLSAPTINRHLGTGIQVGSKQLGSFQLSAKVSSLFHSALKLDKEREMRPGKVPLISTYAALDDEIRKATLSLIGDSLEWETTLDCFAMLISALFALYIPYLPILEQTSPSQIESSHEFTVALTALRFACQMSTDISCKINEQFNAAPRSPAFLCAPAGATCYFVIIAWASMLRIYPEDSAKGHAAIGEKFESLLLFSFRWGIAEKMMSSLERKTGLDRRHYLRNTSIAPPPRINSYDFR
ncbi:Uu.00g097560.m01.CDS01 [Anthostomella pinea]|uniref:Uu.00g097560.m01.CDS01 n=1 Tax=Anthostomella pinea TaxID=933095 RepID=A0AAI8VD48_9PEZI|nr:Uu.00g097560.m01.CDS01 [Anthostomella pinea]